MFTKTLLLHFKETEQSEYEAIIQHIQIIHYNILQGGKVGNMVSVLQQDVDACSALDLISSSPCVSCIILSRFFSFLSAVKHFVLCLPQQTQHLNWSKCSPGFLLFLLLFSFTFTCLPDLKEQLDPPSLILDQLAGQSCKMGFKQTKRCCNGYKIIMIT